MMKVIKNDMIVFCDIDDTLVGWGNPEFVDNGNFVEIECNGFKETHWILKENVEALKLHKTRGHAIVIWSAGGYDWAQAVVKALKLEEIVDLVCAKPQWLYDDLQPEEFMPRAKLADKNNPPTSKNFMKTEFPKIEEIPPTPEPSDELELLRKKPEK